MKPLSAFFAAAVLCALAGCGGPLADQKVPARSQREYDSWFSETSAKLSPEDAQTLLTAQQEIRLEIQGHSDVTGSDAISDAFLTKLEENGGMTLHQMMVLGLNDRIARLKGERDEAQKLLDNNSKIQTHPGDTASAAYVSGRVDEDRQRVAKSAADLAAAQADLARINK